MTSLLTEEEGTQSEPRVKHVAQSRCAQIALVERCCFPEYVKFPSSAPVSQGFMAVLRVPGGPGASSFHTLLHGMVIVCFFA